MKVYLFAGLAAAALAALTASHLAAYRAGTLAAQADIADRIEKENAHAGTMAEDWRGALRACSARGGVFDFEAGACDR